MDDHASSTTPRHSYDMRALDLQAEVKRLELQVREALSVELPFLDRLGLDPSATVIDLGCGPGYLSVELGQAFPQGRVLAVDGDAGLLAQARARFAAEGQSGGRVAQCWADRLPFADDLADLVYSRFLFQHLANPAGVLAEACRVTKPGGWVHVVDTDDGALLLHPEPPGFRRLLEASLEAQRRLDGSRHIGRQLKSLFVDAGLELVRVDLVPFTSEMVGMGTFLDIAVGYKQQIITGDLMTSEELATILGDVRALESEPGAFAQALGYVASGRVT